MQGHTAVKKKSTDKIQQSFIVRTQQRGKTDKLPQFNVESLPQKLVADI